MMLSERKCTHSLKRFKRREGVGVSGDDHEVGTWASQYFFKIIIIKRRRLLTG